MLPDGIQPVWDGIYEKPLREDQEGVFHLDLYESAGISENWRGGVTDVQFKRRSRAKGNSERNS